DEPTGNLDPDSRDLVLKTFAELHADGHAVVLVTHDQNVSAAAERELRIDDGRVCEQSRSASDAAA
ncbi:MAG: ABC transporter ATP-binding protein, partial [Planctomycetota bacterium]